MRKTFYGRSSAHTGDLLFFSIQLLLSIMCYLYEYIRNFRRAIGRICVSLFLSLFASRYTYKIYVYAIYLEYKAWHALAHNEKW